MDKTTEQLARECGATYYSPAPMRMVRGVSMTFEQLNDFAQRIAQLPASAPSVSVDEVLALLRRHHELQGKRRHVDWKYNESDLHFETELAFEYNKPSKAQPSILGFQAVIDPAMKPDEFELVQPSGELGKSAEQERCGCCGYLVTESEHRGCLDSARLRAEVADLQATVVSREGQIDKLREGVDALQARLEAAEKDAARWRRLINASEMEFPVCAIADDPENEPSMVYGRTRMESLIDGYDEISNSIPERT